MADSIRARKESVVPEAESDVHSIQVNDTHPATEDDIPATDQAQTKRSALQTVVLMMTLCSAVFLAALDITIVATAVPTIADYFQSTSGYTWIGSAFLLAAAVVAPSWGKFSDIWGRKIVLMVAVAIFMLGSVLCGTATSMTMLIIGRAVQGSAGGGLLALVSIVVGDLFSPRDRGKYYGIVGLVWAMAFTLGPLIGGALTEKASWRWCFYINLPISGSAFVLIAWLLHLETPKTPFIAGIKAVDWCGTVTLIIGLLLFLLGLQFGGTSHPWDSPTVLSLVILGLIVIVIFLAIERYFAFNPIIPVHLFANASNLAIVALTLCHGITFTQNTYYLPLYFQSVLGEGVLMSAVLILPFSISMSISTVISGMYVKKTGRYLDCIRLGLFLMVLGQGLMIDLPNSKSWSKIVVYQLVPGSGIGLVFQPPMIALQNSVDPQHIAAATASFGLIRNVASGIGVVIGSVAFSNKIGEQSQSLTAALGVADAKLFSGRNAQANVLLIKNFPEGPREIIRRSFWVSMRSIWFVAVAFAACALVVCVLVQNKKLDKIHVRVKTGLAGEEERRKIARKS